MESSEWSNECLLLAARRRCRNFLVAGGACALALWAGPVFGKPKPTPLPVPPPQGVPAEVEVSRGGQVQVVLRVLGPTVFTEFRIRDRPEHGSLTEPRIVEPGLGIVVYRHDGSRGGRTDRFTYAVKSRQGVCAPAEVSVKIVEPPPVFAAPQTLDFGRVIVGATARMVLPVENRGGGELLGFLDVDGPWRIDGDGAYRVLGGEREEVPVYCVPTGVGTRSGYARFTSDAGRTTELKVFGIAPFELGAERIDLTADMREADIDVANLGESDIAVRFSSEGPLDIPETLSLGPGEKKTARIAVRPEVRGSTDTELIAAVDGFEKRVRVRADAVPVRISVLPESVFMENPGPGKSAEATVKVLNAGGVPVDVRAEIAPPFRLTDDVGPKALPPGEYREWKVVAEGQAEQVVRATLVFRWPGGERQVPVQLGVKLPVPPETPGGGIGLPELLAGGSARPQPAQKSVERLVDQVEISFIAPSRVEIGWKDAGPTIEQYRLEMRRVGRDENGKLKIEWYALPKVEWSRAQGKVKAAANGFALGHVYMVRIAGVKAGGAEVFSAPIQILTPVPPKGPSRYWWVLGVVLAGVVGAVSWARMRRRGQDADPGDDQPKDGQG